MQFKINQLGRSSREAWKCSGQEYKNESCAALSLPNTFFLDYYYFSGEIYKTSAPGTESGRRPIWILLLLNYIVGGEKKRKIVNGFGFGIFKMKGER